MSLGHPGPKIETHQVRFVQRKSHMCWTVMLLISQVVSIVSLKLSVSAPSSLDCFLPLSRPLSHLIFNSRNNSSTGFCNSNISVLKSQIKPLWSCPFLVQKPPKVPHCREVGFPAGWSQSFARWIIKPHYHILCGLPPLHCCWLIHLKCTGRAAMPVTYLHFKCPRLKRIWMIRSF